MAADIQRITRELADPGAYPHPVDDLRVHHTHISVVFLAGPFAYKVKKPVDLGFLDFTTLERRRRFCREEVRLNRRLAPGVYLGVAPIVEEAGRLRVGPLAPEEDDGSPGAEEPALEYAVVMERLPDDATLRRRLHRDDLDPATLDLVARRVAEFHREAASGPEISRFGGFDTVAGNARENFEQTTGHVGETVSADVHRRLRQLTESELSRLRPLIRDRAARDVPRDTHGDLHLDHVYYLPDREPARRLLILDCIEFNERFRYADPVADVGFLVMDLAWEGRRDLAARLAEVYFEASGDEQGRRLLPFYTAYRGTVRGKVEGMAALDPDIPDDERASVLQSSRGHWLLALGELERPGRRPCLLLLGGLPGTGKTTLARGLARESGFRVISSDRTRKALAGLPADADAAADFEEGIYAPEFTERTYAACREAAEEALFQGSRVLVDASFRQEEARSAFLALGRRWGVPVLWLHCRASAETARQRLASSRGGASDAGWEIYLEARERWDEAGAEVRRVTREVRTDGPVEETLGEALGHLERAGLHGPDRPREAPREVSG